MTVLMMLEFEVIPGDNVPYSTVWAFACVSGKGVRPNKPVSRIHRGLKSRDESGKKGPQGQSACAHRFGLLR
jgi:hypothetical protein